MRVMCLRCNETTLASVLMDHDYINGDIMKSDDLFLLTK